MMLLWLDKFLVPWKNNTLPNDVRPLLFLDFFCVHMMGPIVEKIQGLGIEVQHIPGGCTYLCQPIDVGINRPIKAALSDMWEDWLEMEVVENDGVFQIQTPSRELIANWVVEVYWMLDEEKCKNAWRKMGFEWIVD